MSYSQSSGAGSSPTPLWSLPTWRQPGTSSIPVLTAPTFQVIRGPCGAGSVSPGIWIPQPRSCTHWFSWHSPTWGQFHEDGLHSRSLMAASWQGPQGCMRTNRAGLSKGIVFRVYPHDRQKKYFSLKCFPQLPKVKKQKFCIPKYFIRYKLKCATLAGIFILDSLFSTNMNVYWNKLLKWSWKGPVSMADASYFWSLHHACDMHCTVSAWEMMISDETGCCLTT